eukprot:gene12402-14554_t
MVGVDSTRGVLRSSIGGISSGINKLSIYAKDSHLEIAGDLDRSKLEINEAEELFSSLPKLSYNVTKINQWGKHQKRVLSLTNEGIANVRISGVVSSLYHYSEVRAIYLRDSEVFVIEYNGAPHHYVYKSDVGYQIVQEITSRLKLRRTTEKKKTGFDIAMDYQKRLKQSPSINTGLSSTPTDSLVQSPASAISRSLSFDSSDSSSVSSSSSPPTNLEGFEASDSEDRRPATAKRATKLSQLLGTTEEQRIQGEIDRIALSPVSNERRSIQQFMSNFSVLMRNPATVVMLTRQFIDSTKQSILSDRGGQLNKLLVESNNRNNDDEAISMASVIEKSLEKAIILRVHKYLYQVISTQVQKDEAILQRNISLLLKKPQEFYGIKDEFITSSNWKSAILELSCLDRCEIPQHKLDTILSSARAIYNYINYEKNLKSQVVQDYFLSADDFLPNLQINIFGNFAIQIG